MRVCVRKGKFHRVVCTWQIPGKTLKAFSLMLMINYLHLNFFRSKTETCGDGGTGCNTADVSTGISLTEVPKIVQHFEISNIRVKSLLDAMGVLRKYYMCASFSLFLNWIYSKYSSIFSKKIKACKNEMLSLFCKKTTKRVHLVWRLSAAVARHADMVEHEYGKMKPYYL